MLLHFYNHQKQPGKECETIKMPNRRITVVHERLRYLLSYTIH